jgi:hypothetical protein
VKWWHAGSLPGTAALLLHTPGGCTVAALFNSRPVEYAKFHAELDNGLVRIAAKTDYKFVSRNPSTSVSK